jgi:hypothetical protein
MVDGYTTNIEYHTLYIDHISVTGLRVMVYKVNFNSISVVSSVLLVEETEVHGENR